MNLLVDDIDDLLDMSVKTVMKENLHKTQKQLSEELLDTTETASGMHDCPMHDLRLKECKDPTDLGKKTITQEQRVDAPNK